MQNRDVVVIGASAGGIEALQKLFSALPSDFPATVLVVLHVSPNSDGLLPRVLNRFSPLPAVHPQDGEMIQKGHIYVAPPDCHMLVYREGLRLTQGPRENHSRPAIDPTFRSAALAYGRRVIGIVLTGMLDDGTSGLTVIRARGGTAIVEDPRTAMFPSMPRNALERVPDAHVVPLEGIPELLRKLIAEPLGPERQPANSPDHPVASEVRMAEFDITEMENQISYGKPSTFGCPECGGVLWEIDQDGMLRFRCRVGHAYTARHLRAEQHHAIESALWAALRSLEESASLYRRMADRAKESKQDRTFRVYDDRASNAERSAGTLRDFLVNIRSQQLNTDESAERAEAEI